MDKEVIARIIDPKGWEYHDDHLRRAEEWEARGKPADHALVGGYRNGAAYNVAESLAKATAILALQSSERGEGLGPVADWETKIAELYNWTGSKFLSGEKYNKAAADLDRGQLYGWLCGLGGYLMAARDATLSPAEPSPESMEGVEYPVEERAFHVVRASPDEPDEHFRAKDRATLSSFPAPSRENAYAMADSLNQIVRFHVEAAIRALSAPAHD